MTFDQATGRRDTLELTHDWHLQAAAASHTIALDWRLRSLLNATSLYNRSVAEDIAWCVRGATYTASPVLQT
jgi:hypothetical protein